MNNDDSERTADDVGELFGGLPAGSSYDEIRGEADAHFGEDGIGERRDLLPGK